MDLESWVDGLGRKGFRVDDPRFGEELEEAVEDAVSERASPEGLERATAEKGEPHFLFHEGFGGRGERDGSECRCLDERICTGDVGEVEQFEEAVGCWLRL